MKIRWKYILLFSISIFAFTLAEQPVISNNKISAKPEFLALNPDSESDTIPLPYDFEDEPAFNYSNNADSSGLFLNRPSNIETEVEYDPERKEFIIEEKVGDFDYRLPKTMTLDEYRQYDFQQAIQNYWRRRNKLETLETQGSLIPRLTVGGEAFNKIFGGNTIDIRPQGYVEVSFGYQVNYTENPAIPVRRRKVPTFDFDQKIQMNVTGKIGNKMEMRVNYNTEASFDFENKMNLGYSGDEDEILKKVEAGNVSLPLNGSLITGGTNLFGIKTEMQFGKLNLTTIFSQSKGETKVINTEGGAQQNTFEVSASDYDANRHFFLAQYFRDHYDESLKELPIIRSSITINKIEVWVTNKSGATTNTRNIVAFMDLGEHEPNIYNNVSEFQENKGLPYPENVYPFNDANNLYSAITNDYSDIRSGDKITRTLGNIDPNFTGGRDFEKIELARLLSSSEYTINKNLGYISLNTSLNTDEVLAVAFNYTANGKTYQVGEFSTDGIEDPQTLVLKLLKGTNLSPRVPNWKLMMKNVYSLDAYQLSSEDFRLDVMYLNDSTGSYVNYLPQGDISGHILLGVMNLDNLNSQLDPVKDGLFDYIEGVTVLSSSGRIIFPVLEPFGSHLKDSISDPGLIDKYIYQSLYDSTKTFAEQDAEHNKFILKGEYQGSSSSEIYVGGQNLARGSVKITAGGRQLTENVDYTVDYLSGIVRIINQGLIESGTPLQISTESEDLFSVQRKTLVGAHANYAFSDKFNLGATVMHLQERPLTQKVNYGDDPISNTMLGLDASYSGESQLLTNIIDLLPFLQTKAPSSISFEGEFAQLLPGHSKIVDKTGTAYIDDFEATKTSINLSTPISDWILASTPQKQTDLFPEAETNGLEYGFNRAKLAWYVVDQILVRNTSTTPTHLKDRTLQQNHLVREVFEQELFPEKEFAVGESTSIPVFNLAFYPEEKGPYNFDANPSSYSAGVNEDGTLKNPEERWGGVMRKIETSDFEAANIEYIEFWMMNPFVYDTLGTNEGGDLYFDLGDISEDILRDSRKSFEQGLPADAVVTDVDTTIWGRVSTLQALVNEFDNDPLSRQYQDIGFDGLNDDEERSFSQGYLSTLEDILNNDAYQNVLNDPAGDNYHYFRGSDYDQREASVLERYKKYNGPDGNSPTTELSDENYPTTASTRPDVEDINDDNTLNEYERYYQYKISIRPEDLQVGKNFIEDHRIGSNKDGDTVSWFQFKVPVRQPENSYGSINDFKSIRFMRMFLRGFQDSTILRFASLDLVRSDWRKYTRNVDTGTDNESLSTSFNVSAVNIEENSGRKPIPYILPPGINRVIDPANPQLLQLNEQSLVLKVNDLEEGDARAVYKSLGMDFRNYKRIKMEVHAEEIEGYPLDDDDLSLFIRLGTDYYFNYYEYEIPLKLTPYNSNYSNNNEAHRLLVWPDENRLDFALEDFVNLKLERNNQLRQAGSTMRISDIYEVIDENSIDGRNRIRIKGSPNLANVEVVMIGIRHKEDNNDLPPKSVEVWLNEFRLSDFNEDGGWAAAGRLSTRLADLGTVSIAGTVKTAGFGSIDSKVNNRLMEDQAQIDVSSSLDLGRFFSEESGVKIPVYMGYSKSVVNPKYNPLDPDVLMKDALNNADTKAEKDSIKEVAQDYSVRKSINFTNVKIDKTSKSGKPKLYDPANFSLTYSYNELFERSANTEYSIEKNHRGLFSYNYSSRGKAIEPFKNIKFLNKKAFRLIKDFNFTPLPEQISFRTELYRHYGETQLRNITNPNLIIPTTFEKDFIWNRNFDLSYNLTRSIKLDFSSQATARIDEPEGRINRHDDDYKLKRDSIITNLLNLGRPTLYHHTVNATYRLPINKIPFLDWTNVSTTYRGMYDWQAGPITDESIVLGNTIENSRSAQVTGQLNMVTLYNKVGFLREVNQKYGTSSRRRQQSSRNNRGRQQTTSEKKKEPKYKEVKYNSDRIRLKADVPKSIFHKLNTEDVEVVVKDNNGKAIEGDTRVINENRITFTSSENYNNASIEIKGKIEVKDDIMLKLAQYSARLLMSTRNISFSYSNTDGTLLPGFLPEPRVFGSGRYSPNEMMFGSGMAPTIAPGIPFLLGWQDKNFAKNAAEKGWLTKDPTLNSPYVMNHSENINMRASLEPLPDLKIELTANRSYSERTSEFYQYNYDNGSFEALSHSVSGNFNMTINTVKTAFSNMNDESDTPPEAFENMKAYSSIIARRLGDNRQATSLAGYDKGNGEYPDGYSSSSQQVMIPAFIAAYTGQDPEKVSLDPFPSIKHVRPNWRVTYDGVASQIKGLNKLVKNLSFSHSYRSSYSVGSFISNLDYDETLYGDGLSYAINKVKDFVSMYDINSVTISEQFSPLINVDVTWINDLETRAELKRTRNLNLSFSNNQLTEVLSNEVSFGLGYRFNRMDLIIKTKNSQKAYSNDLNIRADLAFTKNKTIVRKLSEDTAEPTAGQYGVTIKTTADYMLSDRFQMQLYFDKTINDPLVGSFKTSNSNFGVSFRFTLAQ